MLVRGCSDLSALRERIAIPPSLHGRWAAGRHTPRGVVGFERSPIELVLWVPVDDWSSVASTVGPEGPDTTIALHVYAAREVAAAQIAGRLVEGYHVRVTGPSYPADVFEGGGFSHGRAVRVDGGLLVGLTSA
ncbi:MAG: hypothetical protein F9K40_13400 [Kofleriaceae bacterium]|nr:MAG: hypothetical protein F9K40_13400 [Kofleriaceae bacterium]MBZ0234834.1 hypothetical protein [Kofleriaceae bacterium]